MFLLDSEQTLKTQLGCCTAFSSNHYFYSIDSCFRSSMACCWNILVKVWYSVSRFMLDHLNIGFPWMLSTCSVTLEDPPNKKLSWFLVTYELSIVLQWMINEVYIIWISSDIALYTCLRQLPFPFPTSYFIIHKKHTEGHKTLRFWRGQKKQFITDIKSKSNAIAGDDFNYWNRQYKLKFSLRK